MDDSQRDHWHDMFQTQEQLRRRLVLKRAASANTAIAKRAQRLLWERYRLRLYAFRGQAVRDLL